MQVHNLTAIKLPSILIRMLVLSIQPPSRHFASSRSTVTRDRLEISYSGLVGGLGACLGRLCSQGYGNRIWSVTTRKSYLCYHARLGPSHVLFRLATIDLAQTSQRQRRPRFTISLPLPQICDFSQPCTGCLSYLHISYMDMHVLRYLGCHPRKRQSSLITSPSLVVVVPFCNY